MATIIFNTPDVDFSHHQDLSVHKQVLNFIYIEIVTRYTVSKWMISMRTLDGGLLVKVLLPLRIPCNYSSLRKLACWGNPHALQYNTQETENFQGTKTPAATCWATCLKARLWQELSRSYSETLSRKACRAPPTLVRGTRSFDRLWFCWGRWGWRVYRYGGSHIDTRWRELRDHPVSLQLARRRELDNRRYIRRRYAGITHTGLIGCTHQST